MATNYSYSSDLNWLIKNISDSPRDYGIYSEKYKQWHSRLPILISDMYNNNLEGKFDLELFNKIQLPYVSFGSINASDLFGLDEIVLFVFYWKNRNRYEKVYDLGANIGLHSIILSKLGMQVKSFEPDPNHINILNSNLNINNCNNVQVHQCAVYIDDKDKQFIRVLGNTTGSHIEGMKESPYGDLNTFTVKCRSFNSLLLEKPSLIKMDIEGAEADVICATTTEHWLDSDMLLEVGSADNAQIIWEHFKKIGVHLFSQKNSWGKVCTLEHMPVSYKEGSLFVSMKNEMPWN